MLFSMRMIFQTLWKKVVFWLGGWWGLSGLDMRLQISQFSSCTHTTLCLLLGAVVGIAELQFDIGSCVAAQAAWLRSFFKVWKKGEKRNLEEERGKEREERERERERVDLESLKGPWTPLHIFYGSSESPNTLRAPTLWEPQHFESPNTLRVHCIERHLQVIMKDPNHFERLSVCMLKTYIHWPVFLGIKFHFERDTHHYVISSAPPNCERPIPCTLSGPLHAFEKP